MKLLYSTAVLVCAIWSTVLAQEPRYAKTVTVTAKDPYTASDVTAVYSSQIADEDVSLLTLSPGQSHTFPERQEQVGSATFVMPIDHVSGSVGSNTFSIDVPEYAMGIEVNLHFLIDPQENEGFKVVPPASYALSVTVTAHEASAKVTAVYRGIDIADMEEEEDLNAGQSHTFSEKEEGLGIYRIKGTIGDREFDVDLSTLADGNIVDRYSFKLDPQAGATLLLL